MKEYKGDDVMFKIIECSTLNSLMKEMQREGYKKVYHKMEKRKSKKR